MGNFDQKTPFLAKSTYQKSPSSYLNVVWYTMQTLVRNKIFSGARKILLDVEQNFLKKSRFNEIVYEFHVLSKIRKIFLVGCKLFMTFHVVWNCWKIVHVACRSCVTFHVVCNVCMIFPLACELCMIFHVVWKCIIFPVACNLVRIFPFF